jgi:diacylglycerol kinase family enzyme
VGVIPIGTGNDMSRMFGWGPGYNGEDLQPIVDNILKATMRPMDMYDFLMLIFLCNCLKMESDNDALESRN